MVMIHRTVTEEIILDKEDIRVLAKLIDQIDDALLYNNYGFTEEDVVTMLALRCALGIEG